MRDTKGRLATARKRLVSERPFYGSLAMNLAVTLDESTETADVDGTTMRFNPAFVDGLTDAELIGVMAHEVSHCSFRHLYRIGGRPIDEWNESTDYVINGILIKEGFTLPDGALIDSQYDGMSAEQVFSVRRRGKQQQQQQQNGTPQQQQNAIGGPQQNGTGKQAGGSQQPQQGPPQQQQAGGSGSSATGKFSAPATPQQNANGNANGPQQLTENDWRILTEQAVLAGKKAGHIGSDAERAITAAKEGAEDWRAILREFIEQTVPTDYSWITPNRRYISEGLYLPGPVKENTPRIAIGIDTSGSIDVDALNLFAAEVERIAADTKPEGITVLYCDARINRVQNIEPDEPVTLTPCGGGGTRFNPVFEYIAGEQWEHNGPPACLLYFTDLECYDTPTEPDYPVLFVTGEHTRQSAPFGRVVRLSKWG